MYNSGSINDTGDTSSNAYNAWFTMVRRCYDKSKSPFNTYDNCVVSDEFLNFSSFKVFYEANAVDGYVMDKDILGCGRLYDSDTVIFVPAWVNSFVVGFSRRMNQEAQTGKFKCQVRDPFNGKRLTIGRFDSEIEAKKALAQAKIEMVMRNKDAFTSARHGLDDLVINKINRDLVNFIQPSGSLRGL